jgi:hypothetical protein
MAKFRVEAVYHTYCTAIIEADTLEEAERIADEADGLDFIPSDEYFDWHINNVSEIK